MAQQLIYGSEFIEDFAAQTNVPLPPPNYARLYYNGTTLVCYDSAGNQLIGSGGGAVSSVFTRTGDVVAVSGDYTVAQVTGAAPLASPTFTGTPVVPTAAPGTNTGQAASTAFVTAAIALAPGTVTSVTGTTNQISVATGTTTPVLSTPSTFIAPGSIAATTTVAGVSGTFTDTTAGNVGVAAVNSTAATLTQAQSSTKVNIVGQYWTGAASAADTWSIQTVLTNGTNGDSILTFTHTGSTGSGLGTSFPGNVTIANNKTLNLQGATGNLNIGNALAGLQWSGCGSLVGSATSGLMVFKDNAATGYNRLCFGGTTSAFPSLKRSASVLQFDLADDSALTYYNWGGEARVSTQFDKTNDAALGNVTGLSVNVVAGRTYSFRAVLHTNTGAAAGGTQFAIAGTATATAIIYQAVQESTTGVNIVPGAGRGTALGTAVANSAGASTAQYTTIDGLITVNAAGTLTVQFAQFTSNGTASSVLVGSTFFVYDTP